MNDVSLSSQPWLVIALYKFVGLPDFEQLRQPIRDRAETAGLCGSLLLAHEGINGTIAGPESAMRTFLTWLTALEHSGERPFENLEWKESWAVERPFHRLKVRLKREIVTMGVEDIDPNAIVGTYVEPEDWNALITAPGTVVVDTRNDYEVGIGTFEGALNPGTQSFRQFPDWARENLPEDKSKPVAMFCTGGIRCEKSTAYLKSQGYENVFHLHGGILKYLEEVPETESKWNGSCFVFDHRVSVDHGLKEGEHELCHACGMPLSREDRQHKDFEAGVTCHNCIDHWSEADLIRFRQRQAQIERAKARGESHLGSEANPKKRKKKPDIG
jgi:UPF0176 protein